MEREGREVGEVGRGRRRGGEKMRGILIGGMILSLLLGCNNGEIEKLENKNKFLSSIVNLGNEFLNVFTSFGDMVGGVLGFNDKTKKSEVGEYFNKVKATVEGTKEKLNKIVEDMQAENNPNAVAVKTKVDELIKDKLSKIIEGAKKASEAIGTTGEEPIGDVVSGNNGGTASKEVDNLVEGLKSIVGVVLKDEGKHDAGDNNKASDGNTPRGSNAGDVGKLFDGRAGASGSDRTASTDAAKAVGAVTGADILKAMVENTGNASKLAKHSEAVSSLNVTSPKDAEVAGGIALRAMAKGGKFANGSNSVDASIKRAATGAVTKALDTLTIAIRKTIDEGLKTVKEAMKINPETTPVITESKNQ